MANPQITTTPVATAFSTTNVSTATTTPTNWSVQSLTGPSVSSQNGLSDGMNTTNIVQSNLTRTVPYSNYSINFDAADADDIEIPKNNTDLGLINTDFSISTWLNPRVVHNGMVIMNYDATGGWGIYYNSGDIRFRDVPTWTTVATVNASEWTNILIVGDYTNSNMKCYKNGVEVYNSSFTFTITDSTRNVFIGAENGGSFFFDGKLSNFSIWNEALTADDAINLYNNGISQDLNNFRATPSAWYPMDERNTYFNGSVLVAREPINNNDGTGSNIVQENIVGNAPGSEASGTGTNLAIANLEGNMYNSDKNAYSINMADYADSVTNPANSGRSTDTPS